MNECKNRQGEKRVKERKELRLKSHYSPYLFLRLVKNK